MACAGGYHAAPALELRGGARGSDAPRRCERRVRVLRRGNVLAVDHAGKVKWERSLVKEYGEYQNHHGLGSSPAQSATALFINCQHDGPSYLVALDKETGKTLWKVDRKSSKSWSSPIAFRSGDRDFVAISTAGAAHVYDAKNGEVVWSMSELSGNSVPSPVLIGDQLFLGAAKSDFDSDGNVAKSNCCLKSIGDGKFDLVWRAEKAMCDYASPVVAGDFVYYVSRVGVIYCLDRATGKEHFAKRLGGTTWSTPIVAGEHLYIFGKEGGTTVLKVGPAYEEVAMNPLWDPKNPPAPLTYKETKGGMGHGEHGGGAGGRKPVRVDVHVVKGASRGCCSSMTRTATERSN